MVIITTKDVRYLLGILISSAKSQLIDSLNRNGYPTEITISNIDLFKKAYLISKNDPQLFWKIIRETDVANSSLTNEQIISMATFLGISPPDNTSSALSKSAWDWVKDGWNYISGSSVQVVPQQTVTQVTPAVSKGSLITVIIIVVLGITALVIWGPKS